MTENTPPPNPDPDYRYRSASTGRWVRWTTALRHPRLYIAERRRRRSRRSG